MRGKFNRVFNAIRGQRSNQGTPGSQFAFNIPCRLVFQGMIFQQDMPTHLSEFWLTVDAVELTGPTITQPEAGKFLFDFYAADVVTVPGHVPGDLVVCREERILPEEGEPYRRYLLIPLASMQGTLPPVPNPWPPVPPVPPVPPTVPPPGSSGDGSTCPLASLQTVPFTGTVDSLPGEQKWFVFYLEEGKGYRASMTGPGTDDGYGVLYQDSCVGQWGGTINLYTNYIWTHTQPTGYYRAAAVRTTGGAVTFQVIREPGSDA